MGMCHRSAARGAGALMPVTVWDRRLVPLASAVETAVAEQKLTTGEQILSLSAMLLGLLDDLPEAIQADVRRAVVTAVLRKDARASLTGLCLSGVLK